MPSIPSSDIETRDMQRALIAGLSAYLIWGVAPLFFQTLSFASPVEIVLHRVVWAVPLLLGALAVAGKVKQAFREIARPRTLVTLLVTAALISIRFIAAQLLLGRCRTRTVAS